MITGYMTENQFRKLDNIWSRFVDVSLSMFLRVDVPIRIAIIDVFSAFGKTTFDALPVKI